MQLFKKYCLMLLMLVMVAQAQQSADALYTAASKGDPAAFAELRALGNKGYAEAQRAMGFMYATGTGVPKDSVQAVDWYLKSAEQGNAKAEFNLGVLYATGDGMPKDSAQAAFWYRKSAEQGASYGQSNLGAMYFRGEGVPRNLVIAYMWRNLAAAQGDEIAKKAIEVFKKTMTPAQIAEGQRLSREWKPKP